MTLSPLLLWFTRIGSFLIWLLVGFSLVFWFLRGLGNSSQKSTNIPVINQQSIFTLDSMQRALGVNNSSSETSDSVAPDTLSDRIRLMGVLAFNTGTGAALLSIDQESANPYKLGEEVVDGWKLQSINSRHITLVAQADTSQTKIIELPEPSSRSNIAEEENGNPDTNANNIRKNLLKNSTKPLPNNPNQFNQINQFNQNQIGHNGGVANAGNGIDPNAANPVINANPNRTTNSTNPDPILVSPQ